jgi:predicted RNA-binding Zn ribbon-like protein
VAAVFRPNPKSIAHGQWARFIFIAGRLCIDFTQTGGETSRRAYWERFHQPSDLADWLAESLLAEHIETINQVAARPDLPPQLVMDNRMQAWHSPVTAGAALSTIARDAIDLFTGEFKLRIRVCENPNCGLMFVDASRPGNRRWCLMKRFGNLAKTSTYRKRYS